MKLSNIGIQHQEHIMMQTALFVQRMLMYTSHEPSLLHCCDVMGQLVPVSQTLFFLTCFWSCTQDTVGLQVSASVMEKRMSARLAASEEEAICRQAAQRITQDALAKAVLHHAQVGQANPDACLLPHPSPLAAFSFTTVLHASAGFNAWQAVWKITQSCCLTSDSALQQPGICLMSQPTKQRTSLQALKALAAAH